MPPRRSDTPGAGAAAAADADGEPRVDALTVLPLALPRALMLRIWGSLPADVRMRCREVCPAWRGALNEPRLWTELDLTRASGVVARVTPALLLAAATRAGGRLEQLCMTETPLLRTALLAVFAANVDTLRLFRLERQFTHDYIGGTALETLLRAAPRQCVVEAAVAARYVDANILHSHAHPVLRNTPPFHALRVRVLHIVGAGMEATDAAAFAADLVAHPSLQELTLSSASLDTFAAVDAVVDAALALRLTKLVLAGCRMGRRLLPRCRACCAEMRCVIWLLGLATESRFWTRMLRRC